MQTRRARCASGTAVFRGRVVIASREKFLTIHGITAERWAARYDIEPFEHPCHECGATLRTSIPFAVGQLRGLMAPPCVCGDQNTPYCLVRDARFGDLLQ